MITSRLRKKLTALLAALSLFTLTGCGGEFDGIYDIPLPGGADLGDNPYKVTIYFNDVADLVPQSGVQLNNVTVGNVVKIELAPDSWNAKVTIVVNGNVDLPANTRAYVRQTALLGEKYVQLDAPPQQKARGSLTDGSVIPVEHTDRSVEVEEIFGALSMLLNGGGIEQINAITEELNKALDGNEAEIRTLLHSANKLVRNLDAHSENITNALDALNRLSSTLAGQTEKIKSALEDLAPGLKVLESQRDELVRMLDALRNLSTVAVDTIQQSQQNLIANLKALRPILRKLAEAGASLPKSLEVLITFPFSDAAVKAVHGDYFNLYATFDLNLQHILTNLGRSRQSILESLPILGDLIPEQQGVDPAAQPPLPLPETGSGASSSGSAASSQGSGTASNGSTGTGSGNTATGGADNDSKQQGTRTGVGGIFDMLNSGGAN